MKKKTKLHPLEAKYEEEAKLAIKYSFEDSYDNFDIENILKTYGPVTISLCEDGDILAITQEEYRP